MNQSIKTFICVISIATITSSCKKIFCKDEKLTLNKIDNNSSKLKLNGYYYGSISEVNNTSPEVYLFYKNGIFSNQYSRELADAQIGNIEFNVSELRYKNKNGWGVYKFDNDNIEIEYWIPKSCGGVSLFYLNGDILNDSTFKILYWKHVVNGKIKSEKNVDAIFKFKSYSPKPDSTINFIK